VTQPAEAVFFRVLSRSCLFMPGIIQLYLLPSTQVNSVFL
jgi:hypothetical protein